MSDRTFYPVTVDRTVPVSDLLARAAEAGIAADFIPGSIYIVFKFPEEPPYCTWMTIFTPELLLDRHHGGIHRVIREAGLRPAYFHEGVAFALAHREKLLAALPLTIPGSSLRLPNYGPGSTDFVHGFMADGKGSAILKRVEDDLRGPPASFLCAKL